MNKSYTGGARSVSRLVCGVSVAAMGFAAVAANADVISATDDPYCEGICPGIFGPDVFRDQSVGIRFTPDRDYQLDSCGVWLWDNDTTTIDFVRLTIREGDDSVPGNNVLDSRTFAVPPIPAFRPALVTIDSGARPTLRAGVNYWLVLECSAFPGEGPVWAVANPGNGFGSISDGPRWQAGGDGAWGAHTILGTPITTRCVADVDDGSGTGTTDGAVTIDDLLYYIGLYEMGAVAADIDDGSGTGTRDGGVTIDDLLYYLIRYDRGC
jgi:hypothetical protein